MLLVGGVKNAMISSVFIQNTWPLSKLTFMKFPSYCLENSSYAYSQQVIKNMNLLLIFFFQCYFFLTSEFMKNNFDSLGSFGPLSMQAGYVAFHIQTT